MLSSVYSTNALGIILSNLSPFKVIGVDIVRHSHVVFKIRDTNFREEIPSHQVEYYLVCRTYITELKTVKCSYHALVSSFICMFRLFMNFSHVPDYLDYLRKPWFYSDMGHTYPFISVSTNDKIDQKRLSQTVELV